MYIDTLTHKMKILAIAVLFGLAHTQRLEHGHDGRKFYRVCFAKFTVKARIDGQLDGQLGIDQLVRHLVVRVNSGLRTICHGVDEDGQVGVVSNGSD